MLHGFQYLLTQLAGDQAQANSQANSSFLVIMAALNSHIVGNAKVFASGNQT